MKQKWKVIGGVIAAMAMTTAVQAIPMSISGTVDFGGGVTLSKGGGALTSVAGATEVLTWANPTPYVSSSSGDLSAVFDTPVTFATPWVFAGATANLWSYLASDGDTFTFSLNTGSTVTYVGSGTTESLDVQGTGTISATGPVAFATTDGTWSFSTQNPPSGTAHTLFSFSAAAGSVPDGGLTASMLGMGLLGLGCVRRMIK